MERGKKPELETLPEDGGLLLRLAGLTKESVVDGPGLRATLFVQGCPHRCPGCHNPDTWPAEGGYWLTVDDAWRQLADLRLLRGITFSGGEPFAQTRPLAFLADLIKQRGWDLCVYTGYIWEDLHQRDDPWIGRLLALTDLLVDGPFLMAEKDPALPFRGSRNQRLLDLVRTREAGLPVLWEPAW